jgi:siroheme synthase-like protein
VSGYPIVLEGSAIAALVVGGGRVAERKVRALLAAGAAVCVVAPTISESLREIALHADRCALEERDYRSEDTAGATLVFAATDRREVNARIAEDARRAGILVNVADDGASGDFVTPAHHASGGLLISVTTGGVPGAAARIRDAVADRFDERYAEALARLAELRASLLESGDRDVWQRAAAALLDADFCARVESGALAEELTAWRC